jgi:hypothetical protein
VFVSDRSAQTFCLAGEQADPSGAVCGTPRAACGTNGVCLRADDDTWHCTDVSAALAVGTVCSNSVAGNECRSGLCVDRHAESPIGSPGTTRCAAVCRTNADCPATMICEPAILSDNGTAQADDDTILGFCLTLVPEQTAEQCGSDGDCTGTIGLGDTCDVAVSACYTLAAAVGDACGNHADCGSGQTCLQAPDDPEFTGGYCVRFGCDLGTGGGCPSGSSCVPRGAGAGTGVCLKSCAGPSDCRSSYHCDATTGTCQAG